MEDFEIIQIGNKDSSNLILILPFSFEKIQLIPNLNEIINNYFIDDIDNIFVTNQIELDKQNDGHLLKFQKTTN